MALAADALRISKLHIMGVGTEHYVDHADAVLALVNIAADDADNGSTTMLTRANLLGFALWQAGRYGEGLRVLRDMVGILEATGVPSTSHIGAHARFNMALCLRDQSAVLLRSTCESVIESVIEEGTDTGSVDGEGGAAGEVEGGAEEGVRAGVQEMMGREGSEEGAGEEEEGGGRRQRGKRGSSALAKWHRLRWRSWRRPMGPVIHVCNHSSPCFPDWTSRRRRSGEYHTS